MLIFVSFLFAGSDFKVYFKNLKNHNVLEFKNPFFYAELKSDDSLHLQAIQNKKLQALEFKLEFKPKQEL